MNTVSHDYALKDLEELARHKTEELSALIGQDLQLQWPPRGTKEWEFRDWEIEWFFRAYGEYHLFELKARRRGPSVDFIGDLMCLSVQEAPLVHEFLIAWEIPTARLGPHEYLTQFAAAGELAGIYGQPRDKLSAEERLARADAAKIRPGGYAIDLAIYDGPRAPDKSGKPVIGVEIKLTRTGHRKFIAALKNCRGQLPSKQECGQEHRKCLWIRQNPTAQYLWVRSQDQSDLFKIQRAADGGFDLDGPLSHPQRDKILSRQKW